MASRPANANGHRRRQIKQRHRATATRHTCPYEHCPWPNEPFDPTLHHHDPKFPEVDEIIPRRQGGDPLSWTNTRLMHRWCNQHRAHQPATTPTTPTTTPTTSRTW